MPIKLKLYCIMFDQQAYYVEALTFPDAIYCWKAHVKKLWGEDYEGNEEPDSCALTHDEPVIR